MINKNYTNKIKLVIIYIIIIIQFSTITNPIIGITSHTKEIYINDTPIIIIGPYSQSPERKFITILWQTDIKTSRNEVHWGTTPNCENITPEKSNGELKTDNLHKVIINGLSPSIKYYYKISRCNGSTYTKCDCENAIRSFNFNSK